VAAEVHPARTGKHLVTPQQGKGRETASLDSQNRYAILFRIQTAKLPATRKSRIDKFVRMLEKGEKLH